MADMVGIAEIAKRLGLDLGTVRRLIAREADALQLEINRGKGDRLLLPKEHAERVIASYEARRGPIAAYEPRSTVVRSEYEPSEATYD